MRVTVGMVVVQAHLAKQADDPLFPFLFIGTEVVDNHRFLNDLADVHPGIEGGIGVLEHHLDFPADAAHMFAAAPGDILAV